MVQETFLGSELPASVTIVEVGPRDGLQNEKEAVSNALIAQMVELAVLTNWYLDTEVPI